MMTKTLGSTSAQLLKALAQDNRTVFSVADAQQILGGSYNAALKTCWRLTRVGWLVRLTAGRYAIVPLSSGDEAIPQANRYIIAQALMETTPHYISHESAMDIHNMLTRPIANVIVTTSRRLNKRNILGVPYRFIYAPPLDIWGCEPTWETPYEQVTVSDLEKTILDGLARTDLCAGVSEVATALWMCRDDFDWTKFAHYAEKFNSRAVGQRLGYLLELYELGTPKLIKSLQAMVGTAYVRLDPLLPASGRYLARWHLRLNVEPDMLQAIVGT
jgi:predicted transcriptional regulator of viral defense system